MSDESRDPQNTSQFEGRYANSFQIGHNAFEFVFDFGQARLEGDQAQFHTRIITGPVYAKAFSETLQESINQYEQAFGVIPKKDGEETQHAGKRK